MVWHSSTLQEIQEELKTDLRLGLTAEEANNRLRLFGPNSLPSGRTDSYAIIFLRQFQSPLIYILLLASAVVFWLGHFVDGFVILFVLFFNAVIGTAQEGKAQNTLLALKKFTEVSATIVRDGREIIVPDAHVVYGDLLLLHEGQKIAADARIVESNNLRIDEAALTGESGAIFKENKELKDSHLPIADRRNMVFKGTYVMGGMGDAIVCATGRETEIGRISAAVAEIDTEIPLKRDVRLLARIIVTAVAVFSVALFSLGIALGKSAQEMFMVAVSLAVSVVPEGLPVVLTIVLARGVWQMAKKNVLVKRLQAIEALGQANVLAVDKTGTITKNEMVARGIYIPSDEVLGGKFFDVSGSGYERSGKIFYDKLPIKPSEHSDLSFFGKVIALGSNARVVFLEETKTWKVLGDPTEAALSILGEKLGFKKEELEKNLPLVRETPFDYKNKYHAFSHHADNHEFVTIIGAPESVTSLSDKIFIDGEEKKFNQKRKDEIDSVLKYFSDTGMRILACAYKKLPIGEVEKSEKIPVRDMVFVGLCALQDSIRSEVGEYVLHAKEAGMRVVMISGDHKDTSVAVARNVGIFNDGDIALTGLDLDNLTDEDLFSKLEKTTVFARVTPEHKMRIIDGYRSRKEIIAMTGDGVNDAPSLVAADLGVGMGKIGTEVAKEASDIILLDDNIGTVVDAIEEGRDIYVKIKKIILYLFSTSAGEFATIVFAIFLLYPLPLLPTQILWLNLITDGFLVVALAMEPMEKGLLKRGFKRSKYFIDKLASFRIFLMALTMALFALIMFSGIFSEDLVKARTIALTLLAVFQWFNAWNCRSEDESIFAKGTKKNIFLVLSMFIVALLQLAVIYVPFLQNIFHTKPLSVFELFIIVAVASSIVFVEEARKFLLRRHRLRVL